MFKKEDNFKYFLGGTAVGVTAGLVIGKLLLPNVTAGDIVKSESGFHTKQNQSGYLRDDNALYPGKQPIYHPRSKSASRYEDMKFDNASTFIKPLQKNVESSTTFNNFVLSSKSKINQDKALRGNKECSNYMGATNKTDIADWLDLFTPRLQSTLWRRSRKMRYAACCGEKTTLCNEAVLYISALNAEEYRKVLIHRTQLKTI
ncbi:hypothetical protein KM043_007544 [Ampulex compressa]|nr:hypothetical protein KM043_007544 [Ampulex compressa]